MYVKYGIYSSFEIMHTETYEELWKWSVTHYVDFWEMFWKYTDIVHSQPYEEVLQLAMRQLIYIFFHTSVKTSVNKKNQLFSWAL